MDWEKTSARRDEKHLSFGIWGTLYQRFDGIWSPYIITLIHTNYQKGYIGPDHAHCCIYTDLFGQQVLLSNHYNDVTMGMMASQITSLTILYWTVYSGPDQRKHQVPRHRPLCGEFTGDWWIPCTNVRLCGKWFHWMTSSWVCFEFWIVVPKCPTTKIFWCTDYSAEQWSLWTT